MLEARRPLILVVDDDDQIRLMCATLFELSGYRVATASNGMEALQAVIREEPDVILLDLWMPVMDGLAFGKALANARITVPIVIMTVSSDPATYGNEIGAVAALRKPLDHAELMAQISAALSGEKKPV